MRSLSDLAIQRGASGVYGPLGVDVLVNVSFSGISLSLNANSLLP